jgi:ketosteroid isomerase-like protein
MEGINALLAREACQRLCLDFAAHADQNNPDALAALFMPDAVFERLGEIHRGREAIRALIAGRPADVWSRHYCSNIRIDLAPDGQSASGQGYFLMFRGPVGSADRATVHAEFRDTFVLTPSGWRIQSRKVFL